MAALKGLDDSDDDSNRDLSSKRYSNGIYSNNQEIQNYGQYLLETGAESDIILIVHCRKSGSTATPQRPSKSDTLKSNDDDDDENEHKECDITRRRKVYRRSAADKDIARCSSSRSESSSDSDSLAASRWRSGGNHEIGNLNEMQNGVGAGSAESESNRMIITKRYRLHRGALSLCEYFKSQLSGRWNGDRLREITWSGEQDHTIFAVEQCLKLLYSDCRCQGSNSQDVDRMIFGSVQSAMSILSVLCSWHFVYGIGRCSDYLSHRVTSYNVEVIHGTASRLNRAELLTVCRSADPTCNLLSIPKMKEVLVMAVKWNRVWAKQIAEKEFDENLIRDRADINSSFLKDVLSAMLQNIKLFLPLKGSQWVEGQITRWMSCREQFEIWSLHSNVIETFNKEHLVSITNPRECHFVSNTITAMLNSFITNFFVHKNIALIPWSEVLLFLNGWRQHITAKSISYILNVTPPMFQSKLCECCIDWIEHKSDSNLIDAQEARADIQTVLGAVMKCQQRAKFWEKTRHRDVFEKSPVLKSFTPQNNYGHRYPPNASQSHISPNDDIWSSPETPHHVDVQSQALIDGHAHSHTVNVNEVADDNVSSTQPRPPRLEL